MERARGGGVIPLTLGDDLRLCDDPERGEVVMGRELMRLTRYTRSSLVRTLILLVISGCGGPGSGLIGIATTGGGGGTTVVGVSGSFVDDRVAYAVVLPMVVPLALFLGRQALLLPRSRLLCPLHCGHNPRPAIFRRRCRCRGRMTSSGWRRW